MIAFCSFYPCFLWPELTDDDGDMEKLQLLESGSSDISFRSYDVSGHPLVSHAQ